MPPMDRDELSGIRSAIAAYALWGTFTAFWKLLRDLSSWQLIGWRVAVAMVLMTVFCVATSRWTEVVVALRSRELRPRIMIAAALLVCNWTSYVWAVSNDRVLETALGYFLAPLLTMLIGVFFFGERLSTLKAIALASTAIAVAVLIYSYGAVPWAAIIIATSWSSYGVIKRQVPLGPFVSLTTELSILFIPALAVVAYGLLSSDGIARSAQGWQWPLIIGTGLVTVLPLTLFAHAAQRVPFTLLGPLNFLVPIINFSLGWLVYGEPMPLNRFVGFLFVWLALGLVTIDTIRAHRRSRLPVVASA